MKYILVTHANTNEVADIIVSKIFGYCYDSNQKCTVLISDAGAIWPVKESKERIRELIKEASLPSLSAELGEESWSTSFRPLIKEQEEVE